LLPPAPRKIRRRRGYYQIAMQHVFLVVLVMFLQVFWTISVGTVRILWFSTTVPATVTKILVSPGARGPSYDLLVGYDFGGAEYSDKLSVGPRQAESLKEGDTVPVQVVPERPDRAHLYQENYPYLFVTILLCLFTLLPTAALIKMLWQLYGAPWQLRALMREGAATSARIVNKKETSGRCPNYIICYEYQAPSPETFAPVKVKASMNVQPEDLLKAAVGDDVVVLYQPERPRKSVICRYADYEFVSSALAEGPREISAAATPLTWHWLAMMLIAGLAFLAITRLFGWW
jgi:hypothetical protein